MGDGRFHSWEGEILTIPTGHEGCNSASPAPPGTSNQWGLFSYGRIEPSLFPPANAVTALWQLRHPSEEPFTFTGRIVADVEFDTTPPTTVNMPAPGRYAWPIQFDAQCSDDDFWLADCAGTYYTLDGSTPTTGSTRFTGPFDISETTTVKIFSVDTWGNAEPVQTLEYVIDTVPPTVLSTSPAAGSGGADPAGPISVTFSEPVYPWSASFLLAIDGSFTYLEFTPDADGDTYTYVPQSPLSEGSIAALTVSGALDLAGLAQAQPFTAAFQVGASPALSATTGPAAIVNQVLASNSADDLLAVWAERTGAGAAPTRSCGARAEPWSRSTAPDPASSALRSWRPTRPWRPNSRWRRSAAAICTSSRPPGTRRTRSRGTRGRPRGSRRAGRLPRTPRASRSPARRS